MDKNINHSTEEKIFEAAKRVFLQKGMAGTRMQEIADEAGMNKALLHYYYRSKENLFHSILKDTFKRFFQKIQFKLFSDSPLEEKLDVFVDGYIDLIQANPYVPLFIINEVNRDPIIFETILKESGIDPRRIAALLSRNLNNPNQEKDPRHYIVSLLGMLVFPFAAKPLLKMVYFNNDEEAYSKFLTERKAFVKQSFAKMVGLD